MITLYRLTGRVYRAASSVREWAWSRLTHMQRAEVVREWRTI